MAYVPQQHNRNFSFSVEEVLLMGRAPYTAFYRSPTEEDRCRVQQVLDSLDLLHLGPKDYTSLSGGEMQLVMILRALVQDTHFIIMDEPTAHLDFRNELWVLETIVRLVREKGISLIMATHFPAHAFYLEREGVPVRVAFMGDGGISTMGSPSEKLTEKTIGQYYRIASALHTIEVPGKGSVKQIIPLHTLKGL